MKEKHKQLFDKCKNFIHDLDKTNNKLLLNDDTRCNLIDCKMLSEIKPYYVISLFGKSRIGKSTFLNILCSYLTQVNCNYYEVSGGSQQCTKGVNINILYNKDENIILLDFRGTDNGDSKDDIYLSIFAYVVSDIIIINESKMLYNSTLKTNLEPIVLFTGKSQTIENKDKYVFFRIIDSNLFDEIQEKTDEKMFSTFDELVKQLLDDSHNDQYQQIKKAIKKIYKISNMFGIGTNCDVKDRKMLNNNQYDELLKNTDNYFGNSIERIIKTMRNIKKEKMNINIFINYIISKLSIINSNDKNICENVFDSYSKYFEQEILKWIESKEINRVIKYIENPLPNLNLGLNISLIDNEKKKIDLNLILKKYDNEFCNISDNIKLNSRKKIECLIEKIESENKEINDNAKHNINDLLKTKLNLISRELITEYNNIFDYLNYDDCLNEKLNIFKNILLKLSTHDREYSYNIVNQFQILIDDFILNFVNFLKNKIVDEYKSIFVSLHNFLNGFDKNIDKELDKTMSDLNISIFKQFENYDFYAIFLKKSKDMIYNKIKNKNKIIIDNINENEIFKCLMEKKYNYNDYILFSSLNNEKYYNDVTDYYMTNIVMSKMNMYKNKYMKKKCDKIIEYLTNNNIKNDDKNEIIDNNPELLFVYLTIETCSFCNSSSCCNVHTYSHYTNLHEKMILIMDNMKIKNKYFDQFIKNLITDKKNGCVEYMFSHNEIDYFIIKKIYNDIQKYSLRKEKYLLCEYQDIIHL